MTDVAPRVIRPADDLVVRATVNNTSDRELTDPRVNLRVQRLLISTRGALSQWADASPRAAAGTRVQFVDLGKPLAPGAQADVELRVPASTLALTKEPTGWGPRGIAVEVTDAGSRRGLDRTFTVWLPTEQVSTLNVSIAVPLTDGAVDPKAVHTPSTAPKEIARLDDILTITKDHPEVAWVVDPAMLSALDTAATASSDGADVRVLTSGLATAATGRDIFALPSLDPDLAALAHAGAGDMAAVAAKLTASAPLPVLGTPPRTDLAWPADLVPDQATVTLAAQTGAKAIVVGDAGLAPIKPSYTATGRATVPTTAGDVAALVADPTMTNLLTHPGPTGTAATQRLLAETAVVARERPNDPRAVLLAPGRGWQPNVAAAQSQLAALAAAPWVTMSPLPTLMGTPDPLVHRAPLPARVTTEREISAAEIASLRAARAKLATFATLVPNPAALVAGTDAAALAPLSGAWRANPRGRTAAVRDAVAALAARSTGVSVVPGSGLNVLSKSGMFPVGLRNDLNQDATVKVALVAKSRLLVVPGTQSVTVPARSEIQARIPFRAVGSGDVQVEVTLLAPDGTAIYGPTPSAVRVRADWEDVGTAVVAGLLGLAFLIGIARTIRRGQTAKRGASLAQIAEIAGPAGGPVVPETPADDAGRRRTCRRRT